MSLKVWLPLTGNLENKGLSDTDFGTSTAFASTGKIGAQSAYSNMQKTIICSELTGVTEFSLAYWLKVDSSIAITNWSDIIGLECTVGNNSAIIRDEFTNAVGLHQIIVGKDTSVGSNTYNYYGSGISTSTAKDVWAHFTIAKNSTNTYVYVNGVLTVTLTNSNFESSPQQLTGKIYLGNSSSTAAQFNDLRIYDHCLSAKEVKEISQGLVLHYKLDGGLGGVGKNLTPCGSLYTKESPWTTSKANADGWAFITNSAFEGIPSTTYTISVECDGTLSSSHSAGGIPISDKPWAFWAYICNVDTTKDWTSGGYDRPVVLTNSNNNYRKIGNRHAWTITLSSTEKYISLRTNSYSDGSTPVTINWWNIKVEVGANRTPWVDSLIDSNYDDTKVVDSSGYGRNGLVSGAVITQGDSDKRYNFSSKFTGTQLIEAPWNPSGTTSFTISGWFYNSGGTTYYAAKNTYNTYVCLEQSRYFVYPSSGSAYVGNYTSTPNVWQHIVLVHDSVSKKLKLYINGSFISEVTTNGTLYNSDILDIGGRQDVSQYVGKMSDFRIYATALTADDILDLYHTSANIDNLGDIHSFEFNEVETTTLSDFSLTSSNWVSDGVTATYTTEHNIGDIVKMVPSSGNKRIYHNVSNVWTSGKIYLVSLWAKADSSGAVIRPSRSIADFATPNFNLTTEWKQYYGIINCTTTATGGTLSISYSGSTNIPCYISHIKLEEANKNLVSILKTGVFKENWIDEENFTSNAKILKGESVIVGREFIEK